MSSPKPITILLAEDHVIVREGLRALLSADAILLDIAMPVHQRARAHPLHFGGRSHGENRHPVRAQRRGLHRGKRRPPRARHQHQTGERHRRHLMDKRTNHDTAGLIRYAISADVIESRVQVTIV